MKNQENSKKGDGQDAAKDPQLLLEARPTGELEWHDPALAAAAREEQAEAQTRMAAEAARGDAPHGVAPAGAAQIEEPGAATEPMVAVVTEREMPVVSVEEAERRERAAYLRGRNEAIRESWMPREAAPEPDELPPGLFCGRRSVWEAFG